LRRLLEGAGLPRLTNGVPLLHDALTDTEPWTARRGSKYASQFFGALLCCYALDASSNPTAPRAFAAATVNLIFFGYSLSAHVSFPPERNGTERWLSPAGESGPRLGSPRQRGGPFVWVYSTTAGTLRRLKAFLPRTVRQPVSPISHPG
jgi:hypothetical protein